MRLNNLLVEGKGLRRSAKLTKHFWKVAGIVCFLLVITLFVQIWRSALPGEGHFTAADTVYAEANVRPHVTFDFRGYADPRYKGESLHFYLTDESQNAYYEHDKSILKAKVDKPYYLDYIMRCKSSDPGIAVPGRIFWKRYSEWENGDDLSCELPMTLYKPGQVTLTFTDAKDGAVVDTVELNITEAMVKRNWELTTGTASELYYDSKSVKLRARPGTTVAVKSGGKTRTYTFPASGVLTVPIYEPKLNTKIPVVFTMPGTGYKHTNYLESTEYDNTGIYVTKVKKKSKKVVVDVYQARIGNYLKIKVGKKTYTKKFKKNSRYIKVTQKIKKQKKGAKICVTFYNKYNQVLDRANLKVK